MALALKYSRCLIVVFIMFASISLSCAIGNSSVIWSKFHVMKTADVIDNSIVTQIYPETDSNLKCALMCKHVAAESCYHQDDSSTCYCNNQSDSSIVADDAGTMAYGYMYTVKPGTTAECQDMYNNGFRTDGELTTSSGKKILCDLTSLGWVVFQRRFDGSVDFQRTWDTYVAGFGDASGEFWLGLEQLHQMTQAGCQLHVYLEAEPDHPVQAKGYATYSNFSIGDAGTYYTLYVDGFSGNVGDSLAPHNAHPFSTFDAEHDNWPYGNCADQRSSGWWYDGGNYPACRCSSDLNGIYLGGQHEMWWTGVRWYNPWGGSYSLLRTEMAFRC